MEKREITLNEWLSEGEQKFGKDRKKWKFKCCMCGHIQSYETFQENTNLTHKQIEGQVHFSCEGRSNGKGRDALGQKKTKKSKFGCNYTCGGLFTFNTLVVVGSDGVKHNVFEFA